MSISIITPHFNDFEGLKKIHDCLIRQSSKQWEWIIVDDFSDIPIKKTVKDYFQQNKNQKIKLIFNNTKTNGSVCRNVGIDYASGELLVFLDTDDIISKDFVSNRLVEVGDFEVFKNFNILDEKGDIKPAPTTSFHYLEHFLQAKFIWQTSCILWSKSFLIKIGKFNPNLKRLQDIELSIRALLLGTNYKVIDNKVDFYYCVAPIDIKKKPVKLICESVNYLMNELHQKYTLNKQQNSLLKGYYFLCIRYLYKSKSKKDIVYVMNSLQLFYMNKQLSFASLLKGFVLLKLYRFNLISDDLFIRFNRYFFK